MDKDLSPLLRVLLSLMLYVSLSFLWVYSFHWQRKQLQHSADIGKFFTQSAESWSLRSRSFQLHAGSGGLFTILLVKTLTLSDCRGATYVFGQWLPLLGKKTTFQDCPTHSPWQKSQFWTFYVYQKKQEIFNEPVQRCYPILWRCCFFAGQYHRTHRQRHRYRVSNQQDTVIQPFVCNFCWTSNALFVQ